jgi:hypothetical protein
MHTLIQKGSILIADGTRIPISFHTAARTPIAGWQLVQNLDRHGLLQTIRQAGGKLFDRDTAVETLAFGLNYRKTLHRAINHLVGNIRAKSFNCLEIQQVEARRCLGFPYLFVSVHSWHIQESKAFHYGASE